MIQWAYFPQSYRQPQLATQIIKVFESCADKINSATHKKQESDKVLAKLAVNLQKIGFKVETGKKKSQQINVPVLFGKNGKVEKAFEADAYCEKEGFIIEVEAGRGVTNFQFLKDLFQACMMQGIDYVAIAIRNTYRTSKDFEKVFTFFDTLYKSNRLKLPLKVVLIIGY